MGHAGYSVRHSFGGDNHLAQPCYGLRGGVFRLGADQEPSSAEELRVRVCEEYVVDVDPYQGDDAEDGFEGAEDGVVCQEGAPFPAEGQSASAVGGGGNAVSYGEGEEAGYRWWDIDGPETVLEIQFGEVEVWETAVGEERGQGGQVERGWRGIEAVVGAHVGDEAGLCLGFIEQEDWGSWQWNDGETETGGDEAAEEVGDDLIRRGCGVDLNTGMGGKLVR